MQAEDFVIQHNRKYHYYCEAVILADGDIQYAIPSHQYKLISLYGLTMDEVLNQALKYQKLLDRIPLLANPTHWMVEDLTVVSCWYDYAVVPFDYTGEQVQALKTLKLNGCISRDFGIVVSIEKTLLETRDSMTEEQIYALVENKQQKVQTLKNLIV